MSSDPVDTIPELDTYLSIAMIENPHPCGCKPCPCNTPTTLPAYTQVPIAGESYGQSFRIVLAPQQYTTIPNLPAGSYIEVDVYAHFTVHNATRAYIMHNGRRINTRNLHSCCRNTTNPTTENAGLLRGYNNDTYLIVNNDPLNVLDLGVFYPNAFTN